MMSILCYIFLIFPLLVDGDLNIALHAQVAPQGKIVGSVITTDGESDEFRTTGFAN